jgi:hypothetical protein
VAAGPDRALRNLVSGASRRHSAATAHPAPHGAWKERTRGATLGARIR